MPSPTRLPAALIALCPATCAPSLFAQTTATPDGSLTKEIMPDFLHLSTAGHQIWADAITPKLTELTK
jgi:lysophospholipase L1-like esterase